MKQIAIIGTLLVAACATSDDEYPVVPTPNFSSMGCGDLEMAWRNAQVQQDRLSRERQAINHRYANLDSSNVL